MNWRRFIPFRRQEDVSPEFSSYYQSADTSNQGNAAVLLGFVTLLAAILLVFGLFIGGRAIYNKLTDDDTKVTISDEAAKNTNSSDSSSSTSNNSSTTTNKPTQIPGTDVTSTTPTTTSSSTQGTSTSLPQSGVENIPRTGVEE